MRARRLGVGVLLRNGLRRILRRRTSILRDGRSIRAIVSYPHIVASVIDACILVRRPTRTIINVRCIIIRARRAGFFLRPRFEWLLGLVALPCLVQGRLEAIIRVVALRARGPAVGNLRDQS